MDALLLNADAAAAKEAMQSLAVSGFKVQTAGSMAEALSKLRASPYDLVVVDIGGLGTQGIDFLRTVRLLRPEQSVAVIGPRRYVRSALDSMESIQLQPFSWDALAGEARQKVALQPAEGGGYSGPILSLLKTVTTSLVQGDYNKAFSVLFEHVAKILGAERIGLLVINQEGATLSLKATYPDNLPSSIENRSLDERLAGQVVEKEDIIIFPDLQSEDMLIQLGASLGVRVEGVSSALGLPIFCNGQLQGVLTAHRVPPVPPFTEEDPGRLTGMLPWLSLSVGYLSLAESKQALADNLTEKTEQLTRGRRELQALNTMFQSQMMSFQDLEQRDHALMTSYQRVLTIIGELVEKRKSPNPGNIHLQKGQWITQLSKALGIEDERIGDLAFIYDMGLLSLPDSLLHKSLSNLNELEQKQFRDHIGLAERQAEAMALPKEYVKAVRHHHERCDGLGYPDGLAGDEFPLLARIVQVVDAYGTLVTPGFERPAMSSDGALVELRRGVGRAFDPKVVHAFEELLDQRTTEPASETEIISTVSHELRSPLTYLVGYSELLANQKDLTPDSLKRAQEIHSEAVHMARLVEGLLEMTRLESGSETPVREEVDLALLIDRVVEKARTVKNGHTFVKTEPLVLPTVMGDSDRLQEVVDNLVDNAVKYSPKGGIITIAARLLPGEVEVTVADQGVGMSADVLGKLFEKFYRADNPVTRSVRGTGLGLNLCKKIVEAHGGRIWVTSQEGRGSTFYFTVPFYHK